MQGYERDVELVEKYKIPSMDQYIVAGHVVFNFRQIRKDQMVEQFDLNIKKSFPQQDQDVLNFCCYNRIRFLKLKYGFFNRWKYSNDLLKFKNQVYDIDEIEEAISNPGIVHFAGGIVKPWINTRTAYAKEWWEYAKRLLPEDEYLDLHKRAEKRTVDRDWSNILGAIKKMNRKVYIFGCTWICQMLLDWLRNSDVEVVGFVDNSKVVQGEKVEGVLVYDLYDILISNDISFVISSQKAYGEIYEQLIEYGVSEDDIYIYRHDKDDLYLQALHPDYRDFEYRDLMAKKIGEKAYSMDIEELKKCDCYEIEAKIWR